jgi:uncharacterized protein YqgC (DUF456 family)
MVTWLELPIFAITLLVMLAGLFGLIVPIFPGMVIIWLAALGYGVFNGFTNLGWVMFAGISVLALIGMTVDNVLMGAGARQGGASWKSLGLAVLAGFLGTLLLPPFGGLVAAPLVILLYEYRRQGNWEKALIALRGLATGWGLAFIIRFGLGILMIILWVIWDWRGP